VLRHEPTAHNLGYGEKDLRQERSQDSPWRVTQPSDAVKELLTFEFPPTQKEISDRGREIAEIAAAAVEAHQKSDDDNRRMEFALIDEPAFMIPTLARELRNQGLKPVISFIGRSKKDIKDRPLRHIDFIEV
jgi:hypothetical protein